MRIAIVGSRGVLVSNIEKYVEDCDEIVSGGAKGVDSCAKEYAVRNRIKIKIFYTYNNTYYNTYGRAAPIVRNKEIVEYADKVVAFWDGKSKGTLSVIKYAKKIGKACNVVLCQ